jgi:hypothetical protein
MARILSLTAREAFNAPATADTPIVLVTITSSELDAPINLASDYTQRLTTDPLRYGVISRGVTYYFLLMSAVLPSDNDGEAPAAQLVFANVNSVADQLGHDIGEGLAGVARSVRAPFSVNLSLILASDPDTIEDRSILDLKAVKASYDVQKLTIDLSREPITSYPFPSMRMTRNRFPGQFA